MKLFRHIASLWKAIPIEDKGDRRTRWLLSLLSFIMLSFLMTAAFVASMFKGDSAIALAYVDLVKHLSYVFGGLVATYAGVESFFPSSDRPYWNGGGNVVTNVFKRKNQDQEPPVSPDSADAQVD